MNAWYIPNAAYKVTPDNEQLACSEHVEDIVKNKTQKVHRVGSVI